MSKKVIVFGGAGFLGSHTADALTEAGYTVTICDKAEAPYRTGAQDFIQGDIEDLDFVKSVIEGMDIVYNFAAIADIDVASTKPVETARINVLGTVNTLEASRLSGVERYVFASSVYVFSDKGAFYRASKQAAESYVETYRECFDLPYTILRYGSLYGRRADQNSFIHRIVRQGLKHGYLEYHGDPNARREYIHVADAARLGVNALAEEYRDKQLILTGQEAMRIGEVMQMISEIMPHDVEVRFNSNPGTHHYVITPYRFVPKLGQKLVDDLFIDLGQGLLDCVAEAHEEESNQD